MHLVRFDPKLNISRQAQQRVAHQTRHRPSSRCLAHHPQNPNATKSRPFIRSDGSHLQLPQINIKWAVGRFPSLTPSPFSFPRQQSQPLSPDSSPSLKVQRSRQGSGRPLATLGSAAAPQMRRRPGSGRRLLMACASSVTCGVKSACPGAPPRPTHVRVRRPPDVPGHCRPEPLRRAVGAAPSSCAAGTPSLSGRARPHAPPWVLGPWPRHRPGEGEHCPCLAPWWASPSSNCQVSNWCF